MRHLLLLLAVLGFAACDSALSSGADGGDDAGAIEAGPPPPIPIPADTQRTGDPSKGYDALVNNGYVGCGIPYTAYQLAGTAPANQQLPNRNSVNANMAYNVTRFTTADGIDVVSPNCLTCHASMMNNQVVIGLGDPTVDFTLNVFGIAAALEQFLTNPNEIAELKKFVNRGQTLQPYDTPLTAGVNPADSVAAGLFAHHDVSTLAWSDAPLMTMPPTYAVPVDVPPWWRMKKKNAMFYTAAGRGDHARIMMTASTFCVDSVPQAQAIDAYFPDVNAYIMSLTPPAYPGSIDTTLAAQGKTVFEGACARCHGTYGAGGVYPNYVISVDDVGTDSILASGSAQFAGPYVDWFNHSFYGQAARLQPEQGYYAPPLDGIWATAPFFHNGSVPTIEGVIDSTKRPTYWTRGGSYDAASLGWQFTELSTGQDAEPNASKKKLIYDTTKPGYANTGHTYGDALAGDDRTALIEYLKTL